MQFIWIDAATIIHPIIGVASFLWLIAIGAMLFMGRRRKTLHSISEPGSAVAPIHFRHYREARRVEVSAEPLSLASRFLLQRFAVPDSSVRMVRHCFQARAASLG